MRMCKAVFFDFSPKTDTLYDGLAICVLGLLFSVPAQATVPPPVQSHTIQQTKVATPSSYKPAPYAPPKSTASYNPLPQNPAVQQAKVATPSSYKPAPYAPPKSTASYNPLPQNPAVQQTKVATPSSYKPAPYAPPKSTASYNPLPQNPSQTFSNALPPGNTVTAAKTGAPSAATQKKPTPISNAAPILGAHSNQQNSNRSYTGAGSLNTDKPAALPSNPSSNNQLAGSNTAVEGMKGVVKGVARIIPDTAKGVGVGIVAIAGATYYGAKTGSIGETAEKTNALINSYEQSAEKSNAALTKRVTGINIEPSNKTQQVTSMATEIAVPLSGSVVASRLAKTDAVAGALGSSEAAVVSTDTAKTETSLSNGQLANKKAPKPSPNFKQPTNPPQPPPTSVPDGHSIRVMPPTEQYQNGYWKQTNKYGQPIDPSTGKPPQSTSRSDFQSKVHIPLPPIKK